MNFSYVPHVSDDTPDSALADGSYKGPGWLRGSPEDENRDCFRNVGRVFHQQSYYLLFGWDSSSKDKWSYLILWRQIKFHIYGCETWFAFKWWSVIIYIEKNWRKQLNMSVFNTPRHVWRVLTQLKHLPPSLENITYYVDAKVRYDESKCTQFSISFFFIKRFEIIID